MVCARVMFESLDSKSGQEGRGRRGVSALLSVGIFAALALVIGGAVTAHQVRKRHAEREQQVEFASLPAVTAPKPKALVKAATPKRGHAARERVAAIKSIPTERPSEAEGELATAGDVGALDGIVEEKAQGGGGSAPAAPASVAPAPRPEPVVAAPTQERETILAPRFVSGCRAPEVPSALVSSAVTIRIEVDMLVDSSGRVTSAKVLNPNPLVADDLVIRCAMAQVFEPAQLPDGTKVSYPFRRRFVFKPAQA